MPTAEDFEEITRLVENSAAPEAFGAELGRSGSQRATNGNVHQGHPDHAAEGQAAGQNLIYSNQHQLKLARHAEMLQEFARASPGADDNPAGGPFARRGTQRLEEELAVTGP